jgi:hypothetical protein
VQGPVSLRGDARGHGQKPQNSDAANLDQEACDGTLSRSHYSTRRTTLQLVRSFINREIRQNWPHSGIIRFAFS